ncbi:MAG: FecR protein [Phycisphaerales bacterium]|nr:FecR protein [Phycisphaerales bacterium]
MPGDNPKSRLGPDDALIARIPDGEEAWKLLDAVLDGQATPAERQRLEQLAVASPPVARLCIRMVHLWYGLQLHNRHSQVADEVGLEQLELTEGTVESGLNETMILPALREADSRRSEFQDPLLDAIPPDAPPEMIYVPERPSRWPRALAAAAAAIALGMAGLSVWLLRPVPHPVAIAPPATQPVTVTPPTIVVPPVAPTQPARPDAIISALAGAVFDGQAADPGGPLSPGRTMDLTRGAAELTFDSGATVVITAPAKFRVVGRNALVLDTGSIAAHVPPPAVGFRVQAPGLAVVDQGTNFGVRTTDGDSAAETAVFDGKVEAVATNAGKEPIAIPIQLTAGQAVRHDANNSAGKPEPIAFTPAQYNRDVSQIRLPLTLPDTGRGVKPGEPDPLWQIVSVPNDPAFTPTAAVTLGKPLKWYEKQYPGLTWVSVGADSPEVPDGQFVFRTTIDLTDFDPATVQLTAKAVVDDEILEIRTNGSRLPIQNSRKQGNFSAYDLDLSKLTWKSGANEVDFVVRNAANRGATTSPVGLSMRWAGTASPLVRR